MSSLNLKRTSRIGFRASEKEEGLLRRAAEASHKSLTDFILDSSCLMAEQVLLDQRLFMVDDEKYQSLLDLLDAPTEMNQGLHALFSRQAPWESA
jgi:uncharacterized protein (DUF1778 family)